MSAPELLRVTGLSAGYNARQGVLHDVDLSVREGEITGIVGMNGAGKSTLLKAIAGVIASTGSVTLDGRPLGRPDPAVRLRNGITLLPEGHQVVHPLTVRENLELGAIRFWPRGFRGRLAEMLPQVFGMFPVLEERQHQLAGLLSGGEQQMLAISRALISRPRVMLLDEPSLGLAPLVVDRIYAALGSLVREQGLSLLVVEQNADRLLAASDTLNVLSLGRIVDQGLAQDFDDARVRAGYFR